MHPFGQEELSWQPWCWGTALIFGKIWAHSFLISFALLCNLVFLLCVEDLTLLVPGLARLLLLEASIKCLGILILLMSTFVQVVMTNFWCVLCRGTLLRAIAPVTNSKPLPRCFGETTLLPLWSPVRMIRTVPGVMKLRPYTKVIGIKHKM